jgi:hypothetical protein
VKRERKEVHMPLNFIEYYNNERLLRRCPAERYVSSTRLKTGLPELDYPFHDKLSP